MKTLHFKPKNNSLWLKGREYLDILDLATFLLPVPYHVLKTEKDTVTGMYLYDLVLLAAEMDRILGTGYLLDSEGTLNIMIDPTYKEENETLLKSIL